MAEVIDLSLSSKSIDEAISALNTWERDVRKKADRVCRRVGNHARNEAEAYYSTYSGPTIGSGWGVSVSLHPYSDDHGVHVYATGQPMSPEGNSVMFYEFGSGVVAGDGNPIAARVGARPGSWSANYGTGEFAQTGMWHHDGVEYHAIPGTNAMYRAGQDAKEYMKQVIKEEFG